MIIPLFEYRTMYNQFLSDDINMFTILTISIASIATSLQSFEDQILNIINIKYDIVGFSETRLDSDIVPLYNIYVYTMHSKNRKEHGGGVLTYVSDACTSCVLHDVSVCEPYLECVYVELSCGNNKYFPFNIF